MTFVLDGFDPAANEAPRGSSSDDGSGRWVPPAPDDALLAGLNPRQREAVLYRGQSLLIVAGAGSGKTSVLTRRIAGLLQTHEAWPSQILAITFTNKAAAEMRERVGALIGRESAEGMWISTFHSACVRILRREAENFGFTKSFTICSVAGKISKAKNELSDVETYARSANFNDPNEAGFVEIFRRYTQG